MADTVSDEAFARYAIQAGIARAEQIDAGRKLQALSAEKEPVISLADALVGQNVITAVQREDILRKIQAQQAGGIKQLGPYKLLMKLGEGGMGTVYLAEDTNVGRKVALKVLSKRYSDDRDFLARFRREAQATGKLNHVNIVSAYTVGEDMGIHYYAMEYCEGETLDTILKREVIPWDTAVGIIMQVARGLQHAHEHGIVHRDIKPANLFICTAPRSETGRADRVFAEGFVAKILDLGLAKNIGGTDQSFLTHAGMALGTPHYISPEQARGDKEIDGRTDIYSLGATLYHMVTGQTPFQGSTAAIVMTKHLNEQLPDPRDINENVPDGVVCIIQRMMAKQPADRYRDCAELLNDLEMVIGGKMPNSQAVAEGKSSVAVRRTPAREPAARPRRTAGPLSPVGTRQHEPLKQRGRKRRGDDAAHAQPVAGASKRKPLYIALGVVGVGVLTLLLAVLSRGRQNTETTADNPQPTERPKTETTGNGQSEKAEDKAPPPTTTAKPQDQAKPDADRPLPTAVLQPQTPMEDTPEASLPKEIALDLGGNVKLRLVCIPAGEFEMGSNGGGPSEKPAHKVRLTRPFYMGKHEVTVAEYRRFAAATGYRTEAEKAGSGGVWRDRKWRMENGVNWRTPGFPPEDNYPACVITWNDAQQFCQWATKLTGRTVCLPTEAQWEYACRAGTTTNFNTGDKPSDLDQAGWHIGNAGERTHPVGQKMPNTWGLYDMHGNVWEWCQDRFGATYYAASPPADPSGLDAGECRVLRGGSLCASSTQCRSSARFPHEPGHRNSFYGFRVTVAAQGSGWAVVAVKPDTQVPQPEASAADAGAAKAQQLLSAVLKETAPLLAQNKFADAIALLERKAADPAMADAADRLKQEKADVEAVLELRRAAIDSLRKTAGQKVTLKKGSGSFAGKVKDDPKSKGVLLDADGAQFPFSAEELHVEDVDQYAPKPGDQPAARGEDLRRRGLLYLAAGNLPKAKEYFTKAQDAGLADGAVPYLNRIAVLQTGGTDVALTKVPGAQAPPASPTPAAPGLVLVFEDFEKLDLRNLPTGWTLASASDFSVLDEPGHGKVLRISHKGGGWASLGVALDPAKVRGRVVRISVSAKFPGTYTPIADKTWARPKIMLQFKDRDGKDHYCGRDIEAGRTDWQSVSNHTSIEADAKSAAAYLRIDFVAAEIFFDDFCVEVDPDLTKPPRTKAQPSADVATGTESAEPGVGVSPRRDVAGAGAQPGQEKTGGKVPLPDKAAVAEAHKTIRDAFKADYAKPTPSDRSALAAKLLAQGIAEQKDLPSKYALLRDARDIAVLAGDAAQAVEAVTEIALVFDVDSIAEKSAAIARAEAQVTSLDGREEAARQYAALADEAAACDNYDIAFKAVRSGSAAAQAAKNIPLNNRFRAKTQRLGAMQREYAAVLPALKTINEKPDDPALNLTVGKYLCFAKESWDAGLPRLAKSSDSALKSIAQKDLGKPQQAEEQAALGEEWLALAQKQSSLAQVACLGRAWYWYKSSESGLTGFGKTKATGALGKIEAGLEQLDPEVAARKEDVPLPRLAYKGQGLSTGFTDGIDRTYYYLTITNRNAYPDWIFEPLKPSSETAGKTRTTYSSTQRLYVTIHDTNGAHVDSWTISSRDSMDRQIYFLRVKGAKPPPMVYIILHDQKLNRRYKSNSVAIDPEKTLR